MDYTRNQEGLKKGVAIKKGERNEYTAFENCLEEGGGGSIAGKNQRMIPRHLASLIYLKDINYQIYKVK